MNPDTDHDFPGAVTCCGINNRGVALIDDKVVSHTLDAVSYTHLRAHET